MNNKKKILFLTNVPSPYRVLFFNELGKHCELTVLYQKKSSSERDVNWIAGVEKYYESIFLLGISTGVDNAFCPGVIKYLSKRKYDYIVICGNASPTEILAIYWCKINHIHYCLESDGGFAKTGKGLKEKLKKNLISGAELYFSTCLEHDKYYLAYGAPTNKIVRYPFSSLRNSDILSKPIESSDKRRIKLELGIKEKTMILSVGRFSYNSGYGKGYDILLRVAKKMSKEIGIYIIGDNPTDEFINWKNKEKLTNVHYLGFMNESDLSKYYKAADLFILMTRGDVWGLVINEALGYGLPIITTDKCNAGIEMVKQGENGFIVSIEDENCLKEKIMAALEMDCAELSLNISRKYTIEEMVKAHLKIFKIL